MEYYDREIASLKKELKSAQAALLDVTRSAIEERAKVNKLVKDLKEADSAIYAFVKTDRIRRAIAEYEKKGLIFLSLRLWLQIFKLQCTR